MFNKLRISIIWIIFLLIGFINSSCLKDTNNEFGNEFLGSRAYTDIEYQVSIGPRYIGSEGHQRTQKWLMDSLQAYGWTVQHQRFEYSGQMINNIIAMNQCKGEWVILAAHYDTRQLADQDALEDNRSQPVMGANDGASGVAVLLELARVLPKDIDKNIWLVFFDAEDNGGIGGTEWILGSSAFVDTLSEKPSAVVVLDMIGDADLQIYFERSSDRGISQEIWMYAAELGYDDIFIPEYKYAIIDDHTPFLQAGIPAIDIIDFDYPYWHTTHDTLDKVSAHSLDIVGNTILVWIISP